MIGFLGQLPKPGSVNTGPAPTAPAGGWPPFKGAPGPKQKQCTSNGGAWIGPVNKKWCQMPSPVAAAPVTTLPAPGVGTTPPPTVGTPKYYPPPVDNSLVPAGEGGAPPGSPLLTDEQVVQDFITGGSGPATMSAKATAPSGTTFSPLMLVAAAIVSGVVFLMVRGKKGGKTGGKTVRAVRSKKRRK